MTRLCSTTPETRLHSIAAGTGSIVVCLHSSGSSSSQWRRLIEAAQGDFRFLALDFHGHGRSADFVGAGYSLASEADAVLRQLPFVAPMHLVGHSFGGAVALHLAVNHPMRFASVTVFEPVLFALLDRASPEFLEITSIGLQIVESARVGEFRHASAMFIDYWNGAGTWRRLSGDRQERMQAQIASVARHFEALFADPLPWESLDALRTPAVVLCGENSPRPARAVCRRLATLPAVALEMLPGVPHMGPITHAERVNSLVLRHLVAQAASPLEQAA